jgi:hypothetical protein
MLTPSEGQSNSVNRSNHLTGARRSAVAWEICEFFRTMSTSCCPSISPPAFVLCEQKGHTVPIDTIRKICQKVLLKYMEAEVLSALDSHQMKAGLLKLFHTCLSAASPTSRNNIPVKNCAKIHVVSNGTHW